MRWLPALCLLVCACTTRPAFIPAPQRIFADFQALSRPAGNVAVGALWIEGHGIHGPGAMADNLETLAGISGIVIDNELQGTLSLGVLQYLDLDPSLHSKVSVRLNEVTLVRVKDMARLEGPSEQPRIYEALRVGTATIATTGDVGLAIEAHIAEQGLPVLGRGSTGRRSSFTIEVKDVYLAVHVATLRSLRSKPFRLLLTSAPQSLKLHGLTVQTHNTAGQGCHQATVSVSKGGAMILEPTEFDPQKPAAMSLAAPVAVGKALFDHISIEPETRWPKRCAIRLTLRGTALVTDRP